MRICYSNKSFVDLHFRSSLIVSPQQSAISYIYRLQEYASFKHLSLQLCTILSDILLYFTFHVNMCMRMCHSQFRSSFIFQSISLSACAHTKKALSIVIHLDAVATFYIPLLWCCLCCLQSCIYMFV